MRVSFNTAIMVSLFFPKLLLAAPLVETGPNFPKSITRLLELMPVFIVGVFIEANKHCVSTLLLAGYQKLAEIPFGRIWECDCRWWYWEWQVYQRRN